MSMTLKGGKDYVRSKVKQLKDDAVLDNMLTIDFGLAMAKVQADLSELKIKDYIKVVYLPGNVIEAPDDLMPVPNAIRDVRASAGVKATGSTSLAGSNNDLTFTAQEPGTPGNGIRIIYADVSGTDGITVSADVGEKIITVYFDSTLPPEELTAQLVMDAINNDLMASYLVTASLKTGNNGTGVITTSNIALEGGTGTGWRPADEKSIVDANRMEASTIERSSENFPKYVKRGDRIEIFPKTIKYMELTYVHTIAEPVNDDDVLDVPLTHRELVLIEVIRKAYESLDLNDKMESRKAEYDMKLNKLAESYQRGLSSVTQDQNRITKE